MYRIGTNHLTAFLLGHLKWFILERVGIWSIPVIFGLAFSTLAVLFLLNKTHNTGSHVTFSQKGIGGGNKSLAAQNVRRYPSVALALLLITLFGSFGLFYLSPLAGLLMSVITLVSSITILWSFHVFMVSQILVWVASYVTGITLLITYRKGMWYRRH